MKNIAHLQRSLKSLIAISFIILPFFAFNFFPSLQERFFSQLINPPDSKKSIEKIASKGNLSSNLLPERADTTENSSNWNYINSSHINAESYGNIGIFNSSWNDTQTQFTENSSMEMNFTLQELYNVNYSFSFTDQVISSQFIDNANLSVFLNNSFIWQEDVSSISDPFQNYITIPTGILENNTIMSLQFVLSLAVNTSNSGNYTCFLDDSISFQPIWEIAKTIMIPNQIIEGNQYNINYLFTISELGQPLSNQIIYFDIQFNVTGEEVQVILSTGSDGSVVLPINVPLGEKSIRIQSIYNGQSNISSATFVDKITVQSKLQSILTIDSIDLINPLGGTPSPIDPNNPLTGGSSLRITADLIYENGSGIPNALISFTIGSSNVQGFTNSLGVVAVVIVLPTSGDLYVQSNYGGSVLIDSAIGVSIYQLSIISPSQIETNEIISILIWVSIALCFGIAAYIIIRYWMVKPMQNLLKIKYLNLKDHFEDTQNYFMLMLIDREAGTQIYSKTFLEFPVDPTLMSGFLHAIVTFGQEMFSEDKKEDHCGDSKIAEKEGIQEINFLNFKVIMAVTSHLRTALITRKRPSQRIVDNFTVFADQVENRFCENFEKRRYKEIEEEEISDLIEIYFQPTLISFHILDPFAKVSSKMDHWEKIDIKYIKNAPFYGEGYLEKFQELININYNAKNNYECLQAILSLKAKGILVPLTPELVDFRQNLPKILPMIPLNGLKIISKINEEKGNFTTLINQEIAEDREIIVKIFQNIGIMTKNQELNLQGKILCLYIKNNPINVETEHG